jgi:hypothetical protein
MLVQNYEVDSQNEVMRKLFEEAVRLSDGFDAQNASNAIWAAATVALEDARVVNALARACVERVREMNAQECIQCTLVDSYLESLR